MINKLRKTMLVTTILLLSANNINAATRTIHWLDANGDCIHITDIMGTTTEEEDNNSVFHNFGEFLKNAGTGIKNSTANYFKVGAADTFNQLVDQKNITIEREEPTIAEPIITTLIEEKPTMAEPITPTEEKPTMAEPIIKTPTKKKTTKKKTTKKKPTMAGPITPTEKKPTMAEPITPTEEKPTMAEPTTPTEEKLISEEATSVESLVDKPIVTEEVKSGNYDYKNFEIVIGYDFSDTTYNLPIRTELVLAYEANKLGDDDSELLNKLSGFGMLYLTPNTVKFKGAPLIPYVNLGMGVQNSLSKSTNNEITPAVAFGLGTFVPLNKSIELELGYKMVGQVSSDSLELKTSTNAVKFGLLYHF